MTNETLKKSIFLHSRPEGVNNIFIILSSLFRKSSNKELKSTAEIEESLQCWLRFIVSNSKRKAQQCMLPIVVGFLTNFDKINQSSQNLKKIVDSIQSLRDKFQGHVDFYPTVDARLSAFYDFYQMGDQRVTKSNQRSGRILVGYTK